MNYLPNNVQEYLLKACLLDNKNLIGENLMLWKQHQDFDAIDYESNKLVAILCEQLTQYGIEDENLPRYQGIYKKSWVSNLQHIEKLIEITPLFNQAQIPFIIIKGIPLSKLYYKNDGILKIYGIEISVEQKYTKSTIELLLNNGWKLNNPRKDLHFIYNYPGTLKQIGFYNDKGLFIVLHLKLFKMLYPQKSELCLKQKMYLCNIGEKVYEVFNPASFLYYAIIHGITENTIQWVVDAKKILQEDVNIDWDAFVNCVKQFDNPQITLLALNYLIKVHSFNNIPENVIQEIEKLPVSELEKFQVKYFTKKNRFLIIQWHFINYKMLKEQYSSWQQLSLIKGGYIYLKLIYGVYDGADVLKKIRKKLGLF